MFSDDLKNTLKLCPHIKEVGIDNNGKHYFHLKFIRDKVTVFSSEEILEEKTEIKKDIKKQ